MTYEETLAILRALNKLIEALNRAGAALDKQIPKQPKIDRITYEDGSGYFDELRCPTCDNYLIQRADSGKYMAGSQNAYCEVCGQAIDWSDEK